MKTDPIYHQVMVSPVIGGAAKLAFEIQDWISQRRPGKAELLLPPGGSAENYAKSQGFLYRPYDHERLLRKGKGASLMSNWEFIRKLRKPSRGIVHVHSPIVWGNLQAFLRVSPLKKILHVHLNYTADQLVWPMQLGADLVLISAKSLLSTVEEAVERAKPKKPPRLRVLQNAVDEKRFFPGDKAVEKAALGIPASTPFIVMIANLAEHKGQRTALKAIASLVKSGKAPKLWIVGEERDGDGSYSASLERMRKELGIEAYAELTGFRNDVPNIMRAADYLLLPSTSEAFSLVIPEAQASNAVVLAAPTADIPEIVKNDITGYLVEHDDHEGYASRLGQLIDNPSLTRQLSENAFRLVHEKHLMSHYTQAVLEEYDALLPPG